MSTPTTVPPDAAITCAPAPDPFVGGRRVVQYLVDVVLVWGLPAVLAFTVGLGGGAHPGTRHRHATLGFGPFVQAGIWALGILLWLAVFVLVPALGDRTPGMALLGLRIVRADGGGRPRAVAHLVRALCLIVDGLAFGLVGLVTMLATERRQRVGDLAAGTLVVRAR